MNFSLSEEQQLLKDSVDRFVQESYALDQRHKLINAAPGYSEAHWRQMAELGWLGVSVPEEHGGIGGGPVETMVLMESFGRGLVVEPFFPSVVLGGNLVTMAGSGLQRDAILPGLVDGTMKLAFAYVEQQAGYDLFDVETTAKRRGDGFVLNGAKSVVLGAGTANKIIVTARTRGKSRDTSGIGLFVIDRQVEGVRLREYATIDGLRAAEVGLSNVVVPDENVLGEPDRAYPVIEAIADQAIAALSAEAVGAMSVLVETTNEYLKTREQFGRPIGKFQVLQHQLADMLIATEECRSMMYVVTLRLNEADAANRSRTASAAKHLIGKHGRMIGERAVQLHGGMGMTEEMHVGHYFKRLAMINVMFGDDTYHLRKYAR